MANTDLRQAAKEKGVCLWQIADKLGIFDTAFSKKLRRELPEEEKAKIRAIIDELSKKAV